MKKQINEEVQRIKKLAGLSESGDKWSVVPGETPDDLGTVYKNGEAVGSYEYDQDSNSFWVSDPTGAPGQKAFNTKQAMLDYFVKNDAINKNKREKDDIGKELGRMGAYMSEENEPMEEAVKVPDNVKQFAARKGVTPEVNAVAKWASKLGKSIVGGTAIGKGYDTLILDLTHQGSEVYIDCESSTIEVNGYPVTEFAEFKEAVEKGKNKFKMENDIVQLKRINPKKSLKVGDVTIISNGKYRGKKVKILKDLGSGRYELEFIEESNKKIKTSETNAATPTAEEAGPRRKTDLLSGVRVNKNDLSNLLSSVDNIVNDLRNDGFKAEDVYEYLMYVIQQHSNIND